MSTASVRPARHLLRACDPADPCDAERLRVPDTARTAGRSRAHFGQGFRRALGRGRYGAALRRTPVRGA